MKFRTLALRLGVGQRLSVLVLFGTWLSAATPASAISILHHFAGGASDGRDPEAPLIVDADGNLYGTTNVGGSTDRGTVFTLKTDGTGFTILHSFGSGPSDGTYPLGGLILDAAGNLYGTTERGGSADRGTVFKLASDGTGYTILYTFAGSPDGQQPYTGLILDAADNLYGTTTRGGAADQGTVFTLKTDGTGFNILHSFAGSPDDGSRPRASLIFDAAGNLYGTTQGGGSGGGGTVFTLATDGMGYTILRSFAGGTSDGTTPVASLFLDAASNLYGTTNGGGSSQLGTVFTLATDGSGFAILHSFVGGLSDGQYPLAAVILDAGSNLYGTTPGGGLSGRGAMFTLASDGTGYMILYNFAGGASDGQSPEAPMIFDTAGNLYGTSRYGGSGGGGTVFRWP